MRNITLKLILRHNSPLFTDEKLIKSIIDDIPFETEEIHITKSIAIVEFKEDEDDSKLSMVIDKNIIQFNFLDVTVLRKIEEINRIFSQKATDNLKFTTMIVSGLVDNPNDKEDFNGLVEKNKAFSIKMLGMDFETKNYQYKVSALKKEDEIKLSLRMQMEEAREITGGVISRTSEEVYQEIMDLVLPSLMKFIGSEENGTSN